MNKSLIFLSVASLVSGGCTPRYTTPPSPTTSPPSAASAQKMPLGQSVENGVTYDLPPDRRVKEVVTGNYGKLAKTAGVVENHEGQLFYNGRAYGRVVKGDHVRITEEDRVFVNGRARP